MNELNARRNLQGFEDEVAMLISKWNMEEFCDVPDLLLAAMLRRFIEGIGPLIKETLDWHGTDSVCHPAKQEEIKDD